jgi:hypothetical protein
VATVDAASAKLGRLWTELAASIEAVEAGRPTAAVVSAGGSPPSKARKRKRGNSPKSRVKGLIAAVGTKRRTLRAEIVQKNVALKSLIDRIRELQTMLRIMGAADERLIMPGME